MHAVGRSCIKSAFAAKNLRRACSRWPRWGAHHKAFTLIELLVVISIIALLMALLMPALTSVRRTARALQCNSMMRQIGVAWFSFANDHEGRGPGRATKNYIRHASDMAWQWILNHYLKNGVDTWMNDGIGPIQRFYRDYNTGVIQPGRDKLACPEMKLTAMGDYARFWVANANAVGGPNWINSEGKSLEPGCWGIDFGPGLYGKIILNHPLYKPFQLGAPMSLFRKPARAFLVIEARRAHDDTNKTDGSEYNRPYEATEAQPWGSSSAFRHPGLTANYLFVDGHVERLSSTDPSLLDNDRFRPF